MATSSRAQGTATSPAAVAAANLEAFNTGDWERFAATISPDVVYLEMGTGRRLVGIDQHVRMAQDWKRAFPDAQGTVTDRISSGNVAVITLTWTGTHQGELHTPSVSMPPTGASIEVPASMWFVVDGDKIVENRHYLDMLAMLKQIGALPS